MRETKAVFSVRDGTVPFSIVTVPSRKKDAKQSEEGMKARAVFEMKHTGNLHIIVSESKGKHK